MVKITNLKEVTIGVLILTAAEALGQSLLREFFATGYNMKYWYLPFTSWLLYGLCCVVLLWGYQYSDISAIETLWDAGTSVVVPIVAITFFNSSLNLMSGSGILLTVIGIILIAKGGLENDSRGIKPWLWSGVKTLL